MRQKIFYFYFVIGCFLVGSALFTDMQLSIASNAANEPQYIFNLSEEKKAKALKGNQTDTSLDWLKEFDMDSIKQ